MREIFVRTISWFFSDAAEPCSHPKRHEYAAPMPSPLKGSNQQEKMCNLLLLLITGIITTILGGSSRGLLSPDTAGTPTAEWRGEGEVNVLLRVKTDDERRDIDDLLADAGEIVSRECTL